jgi:hypothetical protein
MHLLEPATEGGTQAINVGEVDVFAGSNHIPRRATAASSAWCA